MKPQIVIAGWGQATQRREAQPPYLHPLDMMEVAAREAAELAGPGICAQIDGVLAVRPLSRDVPNAGEEIAARLGIKTKFARTSGIGGHTPQYLINQAAGMLARGEAQAILICGAETYYPRSGDAVTGETALVQGIGADYAGDDAVGSNDMEQRHGLMLPIHGFPLFEVALWAQSGLSKAAWLEKVGTLWAGFSEVAAQHPNAWTRSPLSGEDIVTPSAGNRPIAWPYTKKMVSLVMADLGAAIILTTEQQASRARGGAGRAVYFLGGGYAKDRQRFMSDKSGFTRCPVMEAAAEKAQARAGLRAADIEAFDLYSCFPCAVSLAQRELGIAANDPRPLTLTGGLAFFGGPGSNYVLHSVAAIAQAIAEGRHRSGLSTAPGWFMHKSAVGIYGDRPGTADFAHDAREDEQRPEIGAPPVATTEIAEGDGTIETYTVIYGRDRQPQRGLVYGRTGDGQRFVANTEDAQSFEDLTGENLVGHKVHLRHDAERRINLAELAA
jgi:acetyl-CoA C-acetyltransferase